ncbi:glycosyltransferase family 9 protein [bacterium]|nr:glycosyltransferase family 9 protein [bacterium]
MPSTLIIRFGALGDLCICGWFLSGLADAWPDTRTTLATKARFAELAAAFDGVDAVAPLSGRGLPALASLARTLRRDRFDRVLDAHGVLRSHLLGWLMGRRPDARIHKDTRHRLELLRDAQRARSPLPLSLQRHLLDRYLELAGADRAPAVTPRPPLLHLRPQPSSPPRLALAPGARWDTKRWPDNKFAALIDLLRESTDVPISLFLGPEEAPWCDTGPMAEAAARHPRLEMIRNRSLPEVAGELARCRALVTNDSGLLHLAEATGTPVVALFGPTVRAFGYFPLLPRSRVLERSLDCRPCSRTGSRPCHRGDLACLEGIETATVHEAVLALLDAPPDREGDA